MRRDALIDKIVASVESWSYTDLVQTTQAFLFGTLDGMTDEEIQKIADIGWVAYADHLDQDEDSF